MYNFAPRYIGRNTRSPFFVILTVTVIDHFVCLLTSLKAHYIVYSDVVYVKKERYCL